MRNSNLSFKKTIILSFICITGCQHTDFTPTNPVNTKASSITNAPPSTPLLPPGDIRGDILLYTRLGFPNVQQVYYSDHLDPNKNTFSLTEQNFCYKTIPCPPPSASIFFEACRRSTLEFLGDASGGTLNLGATIAEGGYGVRVKSSFESVLMAGEGVEVDGVPITDAELYSPISDNPLEESRNYPIPISPSSIGQVYVIRIYTYSSSPTDMLAKIQIVSLDGLGLRFKYQTLSIR